ncbi:hypothetical protein KAM429_41310 [Aquipseudomonas alcaligenes]|uniref:Uncharacterized protein n=1 Tax=Aquipseudomonas alcaligenes TaxID=43263 RepID=A0AA37CL91_AQUAC|nr:hypothetical protein KAM426_09610 [Pseudomonas alcaligenes]GIZ73370.1 hypothetical protein KAM429_41310 [Pseudomonas alcaligenes]GIZ77709.1 hypothetical protein KAM430_41180 [Pseudomonas alcaligenes]GIZ82065.1 hypothetical protein KAM432_41130 [Pseudomonas alcaligenes]GIZ86430.1 hypothetical protein KAM434_41250 [Pseudomonas alcaligenes]
MSERVVSAALNELVEAGALERDAPSRVGSGGRASVAYKLSSCHVDALEDGFYPQHAELLQVLFSGADMVFPVLGREPDEGDEQDEQGEQDEKDEKGGGKMAAAKPKKKRHPPPGGRGRLSIRNRLLFAVLLSRSDQFGEVQIGFPELAQLTGMKPTQVKNRLFRLMHLGLIRRYVAGLSSKVFALRKVNSTYFLNIDALGPQGSIAIHIARDPEAKRFIHADLLQGDCAKAMRGETDGVRTPSSLLQLLAGQEWGVFSLFQHLLSRYASHLLSRHWQDLGSGVQIEDAELMASIKKDFIREPQPGAVSETDIESEEGASSEATSKLKDGVGGDAEQTCECIYSMAIDIAREYRARFCQANWVDFESADIRILPAKRRTGYRAITLMFRPALVDLPRFSVFLEGPRESSEIWSANDETEITLKSRLMFGLATLPPKARKVRSQ